MPPNTPVPIERRAPAPAPLASTSGKTPSMKASAVMSDRTETRRAGLERGRRPVLPFARLLRGELDDQDGVLGREPDQQHEPDLGVDVARHTADPQRQQRAQDRDGGREMTETGRLQLSYCATRNR